MGGVPPREVPGEVIVVVGDPPKGSAEGVCTPGYICPTDPDPKLPDVEPTVPGEVIVGGGGGQPAGEDEKPKPPQDPKPKPKPCGRGTRYICLCVPALGFGPAEYADASPNMQGQYKVIRSPCEEPVLAPLAAPPLRPGDVLLRYPECRWAMEFADMIGSVNRVLGRYTSGYTLRDFKTPELSELAKRFSAIQRDGRCDEVPTENL